MNILFVCATNTIRSPMAEALTYTYFPSDVTVFSAGIKPGNEIHPLVIVTMADLGINIKDFKPRKISDLAKKFTENLDYLIILGLEDYDHPFKAKNKLRWFTLDPSRATADKIREEFQIIRDEIGDRIKDLAETI